MLIYTQDRPQYRGKTCTCGFDISKVHVVARVLFIVTIEVTMVMRLRALVSLIPGVGNLPVEGSK